MGTSDAAFRKGSSASAESLAKRRGKLYTRMGIGVAAALAAVAVLSAAGITGPGIVPLGTAFFANGAVLAIVAGATIALLMSLEQTVAVLRAHELRLDRERDTRIAQLGSMQERIENREAAFEQHVRRAEDAWSARLDGFAHRFDALEGAVERAGASIDARLAAATAARDHAIRAATERLDAAARQERAAVEATKAHHAKEMQALSARTKAVEARAAEASGLEARVRAAEEAVKAHVKGLEQGIASSIANIQARLGTLEKAARDADDRATARIRELEGRVTSRVTEEDRRVENLEKRLASWPTK